MSPLVQLRQVPDAPTQSHAILSMHHPSHPSVPHQPPSVTSLPSTPSTANRPTSLSANAGASVPRKKITIKNPSGQEIDLDALARTLRTAHPIAPVVPPPPASYSKKYFKRLIRIERQEQKERRLAEERAREGESGEGPRSSDTGIGFQMGKLSTSAKMASDECFAAANRSVSISEGQLAGPPPTMGTISQSRIGRRDRIRSKRGANGSNHASLVSNPDTTSLISNMGPPMEPVTLEVSANLGVAGSTRRGSSSQDGGSPEVDRIVKALLNQLTTEHFDSISDQIIVLANKSEKEKDCRTLIRVVKLVFEKATDEATFSEMYARLCHKIMEQISPKVQDDGIKNSEGKPFAGGNLFRRYLLNHCQQEFERSPVAQEATAAAATSKAIADEAVMEANEKTKGGEEPELYSDAYHAAAKARRCGLGLMRFIGELFKLQMLAERVMHECIKKLLGNVENPEEEEIESLCELLITVGSLLDTPKARAHLDVYFSRMRELTKNKNINARMVSMLQVCISIPCAYDIH
jgi:translation initiation factor 4G